MSTDDAKMSDVPAAAAAPGAHDDAPAAATTSTVAAAAAPPQQPQPQPPPQQLESQLDALLAVLRGASTAPALIDATGVAPSSSVRDVWSSLVGCAGESLRLLCRSDLPRRLMREEHLATIGDTTLRIIREVAMPLFDGEARDKSARAAAAAAAGGAAPAQSDSDYWSQLLLQLRQLLYSSVSLLMLLTRFADTERLPESLSSKLLDASFLVLGANPVSPVANDDLKCLHALQSAAASWVQHAFMSGDRTAKQAILDGIAHTYRAIHPSRRHLRIYVVHEGRAKVKKETGAAAAAAATTTGATPAADLAAAIGSTVPLPTADFGERQQISVQLLSALVCQLLQSITAEPMLRSTSNAEPLLDRIQREVRERDLAEAAAKVAAAEEAAAAAAAASGKKGSKKKKGRRGSKDATADEEMKNAEIEAPVPASPAASGADASFSSLHSALDTPQVRAEFIATLTAPVDQLRDFAIYFLRKFFDSIQPPAKDAAASSHALKTKDARLLLKHFVEDLLQMTFSPEFPVAEQMLLITVNLLCRTLDGIPSTGPKLSDGFRLLCLPTLSLITVHLKLHAQIAEKQPILFRPHKELDAAAAAPMEDADDAQSGALKKEEVFDCYCGLRCTAMDEVAMLQIVGSEFLLDCDECHTWYHGECCGFDPQTQLPSEWHCEKCVIRMECDRQTKELQARREKLVAMREATSAASTSGKNKGHKKQDSGDSTAARRAQAALAAVDEQLQSAGADGVARVSASVLRQLLINYLNAAVVTGNDKTFLTSRQYDLCSWLAQDRDAELERRKSEEKKEDLSIAALALEISPQFERDLDACQLNWDPPAASTAAASSAATSAAAAAAPSAAKCILITHDVAVNMSRQLSWDRSVSVLKYHNRIIDSLCRRCFDPAPGCRKAAVDSLADLIRVDPHMLNDKRVKAALQKRLEDTSIRTREAVVDLLGAHMFQSQQAQVTQQQQQLSASASNGHAAAAAAPVAPALPFDPSSEYFNFILGRLNDVGISVRKKVVGILQKLCLQANPHPRYIELCEKLIMCVRDSEESMQSLAVMTVLQMWFDRMQPNIAQRHRGVKIEVKPEPTVKTEGDASSSAAAAAAAPAPAPTVSSAFTPQFEQMVNHIVSVISRLSDNQLPQSGSISEGAECLADIMLLLLEQDASLNKSGSGGGTVMTSLTGLRMTLGKKKRASSISHMRSVSNTPTASPSSLSAAFSGEAGAKKKRGQSMAVFDVDADPNSIRHICEDMVAVIIKMLVNSPAASAAPIKPGDAAAAAAASGPNLLQLIQALQVFCQVFPPLLLPHIQTLLPYLKLGTEDTKGCDQLVVASNLRVVSLLLEIFREVLPILAAPVSAGALMTPQLAATATSLASDGSLMAQLQMEIQSIAAKSLHSQLIAGATPVYVFVCEHLTRQPEMIATLARLYMSWLWSAQVSIAPGQRLSGNTVRCIVGLGLLIKHFNLEAYFERENYERRQAELVAAGATPTPRLFWVPITNAIPGKIKADADAKLKQDAEFKRMQDVEAKKRQLDETKLSKPADVEASRRQAAESKRKQDAEKARQDADKARQDTELRNLYKFSVDKLAPMDQLKTIPIVEHVFALFKTFLKKMLGSSASASAQPAKAGHEFLVLQGILHLFSRKPKLIAMSKDAFELCLAPTAPVSLQRSTLKILREFMQTEDRRVQKSQRLERVKGKSATPQKAAGKKKAKKRKSKGGNNNDEEDEEEEAEDQPAEEEEEAEFAMEDESMTPDEVAAAAAAASSGNGAGGSWVETKVEASDLMPTLVNMCEKRVYALALAADPTVRLQALLLMGEILHQAVTNPIDAMATIIAALTDREPSPAKQAALIVNNIVKQVPAWMRFMEQRFMEGIRLSFDMQGRLWSERLDPLHRRNLNPNPKGPAVFDRPPTEGLVQAYDVVIKKTVSARKAFCKSFITDLMSVRHIGIFERQSEAPLTFSSSSGGAAPAAAASFTSPLKQTPLELPASLNSRTVSITSVGAGSPLETIEETPPSQLPDDEAPAFVPPTFERAVTLPLAFPSPSSVRSGDASAAAAEPSPTLQLPVRPASPLEWLAYLAGICTALRFEDDEPMHMISSLSGVINTRGAALQAQIQTTIVALKKLHHETVTEEEELQASQQTMQLAQPLEEAGVLSQQSTQPTQDKEALLHDLHLQCESAMAISILIRLRDWLQDSYDCAGRYEEWSGMQQRENATANSVSASSTRVPLKLRKVLDKECLFADLPLDEQQAEEIVAAAAKKSAGIQASPRKVAGQSKASKAAAHARSASVPVLPLTRSCIPVICQAQFASFNAEMERHAVFLAAKPSGRRGHKRSATMGPAAEGSAGDAATAAASSEPTAKKSRKSGGGSARTAGGSGSSGGSRKSVAGGKANSKSKKKKRSRYDEDDDESEDEDEEEEEPEEEEDEEEEDATPAATAAASSADAAEDDEGEWEQDWDDDDVASKPKKKKAARKPAAKKASRTSAGGQRKKPKKTATVDLTIDEGDEGEEDE